MTTTELGQFRRELDLLAGHVGILELRHRIILAEADQGASVPDATRPLHPHEIEAQVRFGKLDKLIRRAAAAASTTAGGLWDWILDALGQTMRNNTETPGALVTRLNDLRSMSSGVILPGLPERVGEVSKAVSTIFADLYDQGAVELLAEARRQGMLDTLLPHPDRYRASQDALDRIDLSATRVAEFPGARLLPAAYERAVALIPEVKGHQAAEIADRVTTALTDLPRDGLTDVAAQGAHQAHGMGRQAAAVATPTPKSSYASELLDRSTCLPCSHVDGHEYDTLNDAWDDYPLGGPYRLCEGGLRCRGTVIVIWPTESDPTVQR